MNFLKAARFYRNDISKQNRNTHPDLTEVNIKKISARSVQPFQRKRLKKFFSCSNTSNTKISLENLKCFLRYKLAKFSLFRNYTTWHNSDFYWHRYSTPRYTFRHENRKIKKRKIFFGAEFPLIQIDVSTHQAQSIL
jgi:hypothetical protein